MVRHVLILGVGLLLAVPTAEAQEAKVVRVVKQPGLRYLELIVMREFKLMKLAWFPHRDGWIKKVPSFWKQYAFEHLHSLPRN